MTSLSAHDKAVLNCIFNPSLPLEEAYKEELSVELVGKYNFFFKLVYFTVLLKSMYTHLVP